MKKLIILALMILTPSAINAETIIKIGVSVAQGKVEEVKFTLSNAELKLEQSILGNLGLGFGFRKETNWAHSGYYFSLYPTYKFQFKKYFIKVGLGAEYGLPVSNYDHYSRTYDQAGNLIAQKWIYLVQNVSLPLDFVKGNTGVLYPFATISCGTTVWKKFIVEVGLGFKIMKFGIKSCNFDPQTWRASDMVDKKIWAIIPSLAVQIGYRL